MHTTSLNCVLGFVGTFYVNVVDFQNGLDPNRLHPEEKRRFLRTLPVLNPTRSGTFAMSRKQDGLVDRGATMSARRSPRRKCFGRPLLSIG